MSPASPCSLLPLDVSIPEELEGFDQVLERVKTQETTGGRHLPPITILPPNICNATDCAKHQIEALWAKSQDTAACSLSQDEEDALDDGFFLCDLHVVYQKLVAWRRLFPRIKPFYALKCNPDPMVAAILGCAQGNGGGGAAGFDCASIPEIALALECQPSSRACIYANPQRAEHDLDKALQQYNVRVLTLDGPEEMHKIHWSYQQQQQQENSSKPKPPLLVLRILVPDEHSSVPLGEKFGLAPDCITDMVELALDLKLPIVGVSFHCGSGNHNPDSYAQAIGLAKAALDTINALQVPKGLPPCWLLDIGGGYPGEDGAGAGEGRFSGYTSSQPLLSNNNNEETAAKIAHVVSPLIDQLFPLQGNDTDPPIHVVSEPGRYFVEQAFCLCSRIYRRRLEYSGDDGKTVSHCHYYIAQGVQGVFKDCVLCQESFVPTPLRLSLPGDEHDETMNGTESCTLIPSTVHGPSGEDYDVICANHLLPPLDVGDWLVFDGMGAYTLSIAARIGRPAVRYVVGGGGGSGRST